MVFEQDITEEKVEREWKMGSLVVISSNQPETSKGIDGLPRYLPKPVTPHTT